MCVVHRTLSHGYDRFQLTIHKIHSGSQFFITVGPTPHLDRKHVVLGVVEEGWDTVRLLESMGTRSGLTKKKCVIKEAGVLATGLAP